jgi:hypothetical protein
MSPLNAATCTIISYTLWVECCGKNMSWKQIIIWLWGQRSRSHGGQYGTQHTALWSCTHIPNINDKSGKTKKLWFGKASLIRSGSGSRSGRKNQTKTLCLSSFEGET